MSDWRLCIGAILLSFTLGVAFGCAWYEKKVDKKFDEAVDEEVSTALFKQREAMIKREQMAKEEEKDSVAAREKAPEILDDPSWHLEEEGNDIFCIDKPTYEGTNDSVLDYYFDKVDVAYSIASGKLFENFSQGDNSVKCYYKDEKLCSFLADGPEEPDSEGYIYVRDLLRNTDYRVKMEEAINDVAEEKEE